ncbi:MAG: hybrid sensor histidine kinase/response regulator [Nitrospirae bacterium]|nr:hybrid sensor histidine kinase/response regulator [Nitrospirota bacterium]
MAKGFDKSAIIEFFLIEAGDHITNLNSNLLALENNPQNIELIDSLFRDAHTLKGSSAMMGFGVVSDVAHRAEDILESVRSGKIVPDRETINFVFEVLDIVKVLLDDIASGRSEDGSLRDAINKKYDILVNRRAEKEQAEAEIPVEGVSAEAEDESIDKVYQSLDKIFVEKEEGESDVINVEEAIKEVEDESEVKEENKAEDEEAEVSSAAGPARPLEVERRPPGRRSADVSDIEKRTIRVQIDQLSNLMNLAGELVVNRNRVVGQLESVRDIRDELEKSKARLLKVVKDFESKYEFNLSPMSFSSDVAEKKKAQGAGGFEGFFELEFDRYDDFNILSRKLVEITNDMSEIMVELSGFFYKIEEGASQISKITTSLQEEITFVRMVEIEKLFQRFTRLVRDVSQSQNKKVRIDFIGGDTKIDKAVFELIADPLIHIIRNAISHGIEAPYNRKLNGKDETGLVYVKAHQEGNNVVIEIGDDGNGINPEDVKEAAIGKKFIARAEKDTLTDEEAINLIFLPGFSTSKEINAISGRGVGMDVVKTNIMKLNGQIEVQTEVGAGTKFIIKLPSTLAVSQALIVKSGDQEFAIPLNLIDETTRFSKKEIDYVAGSEVVNLRGRVLPLLRLEKVLNLHASREKSLHPVDLNPTLILKLAEKKIALMVDDIAGQEEIVVKGAGAYLKNLKFFSGATISGDGDVRFIIDTAALVSESLLTGKKAVDVKTSLRAEKKTADAGVSVKKQDISLEKPRIIIVDDSISIRKYVSHFLIRAGYEVEVASDGFEALNKVGQIKVDLIITDLEMPIMHGYELIAELKRNPELSDIPIIVLTSRAGEKHRQKAFEMGAQEYVVKPFEEEVLLEGVKKLLK